MAAKAGNGVVIGVSVGGKIAKGSRVIARSLNFTAGENANGITVSQQAR